MVTKEKAGFKFSLSLFLLLQPRGGSPPSRRAVSHLSMRRPARQFPSFRCKDCSCKARCRQGYVIMCRDPALGRRVMYAPASAVEVFRCAGAARLAKAGASVVYETAPAVVRSGVVPVLGCTVLYQNGNVEPGTPRVSRGKATGSRSETGSGALERGFAGATTIA